MQSEVTQLLERIEGGDAFAASELLPVIYQELRRLAASKLSRESPGQTLQPTGLVHEAYLRLLGGDDRKWVNSRHFLAAAAEAMRRILIENARRKRSLKRGGKLDRAPLRDEDAVAEIDDHDQLLDLDRALTKLAASEPELSRLVELRYFAGLTNEQAALALHISERTAKRHWSYARAWLRREMDRDLPPDTD